MIDYSITDIDREFMWLSWATCPITENGFVRVASHPNYPNRPGGANVVKGILQEMCEVEGHQFWSDSISILDLLMPDRVVTHSQITDLYLLGLAVQQGGMLATLDRHIPTSVMHGGRETLEAVGKFTQ